MDMDLQGFLATRRRADGLVTTDAGHDLTDKELRAYCRWGLAHGYTRLKELPEFETIENELNYNKARNATANKTHTELL